MQIKEYQISSEKELFKNKISEVCRGRMMPYILTKVSKLLINMRPICDNMQRSDRGPYKYLVRVGIPEI